MEPTTRGHLKAEIEALTENIGEKRSVLVAFSGGVDSTVVAALAYRVLGDKVLAVTVDSPLLPSMELNDAREIAKQIGVKHTVIRLNELDIPGFKSNPPDRCYLCKQFRFTQLKAMAEEGGFHVIADGTNTSDLGQYRPGLRAVEELGVYSPLIEVGLSKEDTRDIAEWLGLPVAKKAASACLASRIPYGQELTAQRLQRIDQAEGSIRRALDVRVLRLRDHGDLARIEVGANERRLLYDEELMSRIAEKLKELGYSFVTMDLEGYRFGSYDDTVEQT